MDAIAEYIHVLSDALDDINGDINRLHWEFAMGYRDYDPDHWALDVLAGDISVGTVLRREIERVNAI